MSQSVQELLRTTAQAGPQVGHFGDMAGFRKHVAFVAPAPLPKALLSSLVRWVENDRQEDSVNQVA